MEVDENQHKHYAVSCECRRAKEITQSMMVAQPEGKRILFRFNPDAFQIDGVTKKLSYKERLKRFTEVFQSITLPEGQTFGIVYLFYDSYRDEQGKLHLEIENDKDFTLHEHIIEIIV